MVLRLCGSAPRYGAPVYQHSYCIASKFGACGGVWWYGSLWLDPFPLPSPHCWGISISWFDGAYRRWGKHGHTVATAVRRGYRYLFCRFGPLSKRFQTSAGNADIAFWLISQRILPPVAVVIPIYIMFQQAGLLDTRTALIITYMAVNLPIVVWLMRDYFVNIPLELEESARVDGASPYRVFWSIVLPLSVPGLVATFLFVLVFAWNEYLLALFLSRADAQTMPLLVAAQNATRGPQWWYMSVYILIMIIPVILLAIALERYISRGLLVGAVKG